MASAVPPPFVDGVAAITAMQPFAEVKPPTHQSWWRRLLQTNPDRARHAIESLLRDRDPGEISSTQVADSLSRERLRGSVAHELLLHTWLRALREFLADDALSTEEIAYLDRLRHALGLNAKEVLEAERRLTHPRYQKAVADVLADAHVSDRERQALTALGERLRLPEEIQLEVYRGIAGPIVQGKLDDVTRDRRVSTSEQKAFASLAENLGFTVSIDAVSQELFDRFALLWRIENGDFPQVAAPIHLQRGETCYYSSTASWHELRTRTKRIDYAGVSKSIRVVGGLRLRLGSIVPHRITADELVEIDRGTVYITNKRIIFDGSRKNTAIRLSSLIGLEVYSDAVVLEKATGRSPHLMLADGELAGSILSNAMLTA